MARARRKSTGDVEPAAAAAGSKRTAGGRRQSLAAAASVADEAGPSDTPPAAAAAGGSSKAAAKGRGKKARVEQEQEQEQEQKNEVEVEVEEAPLFFIDREESASASASAGPVEDGNDGMVVVAGEDVSVRETTVARKKQGKGKGKGKDQQAAPANKKARRTAAAVVDGGDGGDEEGEEKGEEEALLEKLVFGKVDAAELFGAGLAAARGGGDVDDEEEEGWAAGGSEAGGGLLRPAWEDEDDAGVRVDIAGKDRLRKLRAGPEERAVSGAEYQERLRARFQDANKAALEWAALPNEAVEAAATGRRGRRRRRAGSASSSSSSGDEEEPEEDEDEDDTLFKGLFQSSAPLVGGGGGFGDGKGGGRRRLQPGVLEVLRCRDANLQEPSQAVVQAVQFHPTQGGLLLTGGFDKTLRLFQADGKRNEKRAGVFFPDLPIQSAAFVDPHQGGAAGGGNFSEVVVSGRRPFFYWYDTVSGATGKVGRLLGRHEKSLERFAASPDGKWLAFTGQDGYVLLVSARTKQWAGEFKMNGTARAVCFSHDGAHLLASGGDAVVYRWDLRSQRCLARFRNEGGTVTSALAHAPGAITAVGAESGVVNLYDDADTLLQSSTSAVAEWDARPLKALPHLTTAADTLCFNHDGQLLCMASRWKRDSLKMVHVPSRTVFANWPTGQTPIRYASAVGFSPNSGLLAVGNDRGRVLLYRLRHYDAQ